MRIITSALVCSLLAAGCIGGVGDHRHGNGPDGGTKNADAGACDNLDIKHMNLVVSGSAGFTGLPSSCWELDGKLTLTGPAVTSLAKLGDLRKIKDLEIGGTELTKLDTKSPFNVTGAIYVHNNAKLTDLSNLAPQDTVAGIRIEGNAALVSLGGLASVTGTASPLNTGDVSILNNGKLATAVLTGLRRVEGNVVVQDNPALTSLDMTNLDSSHDFTVRHNAVLIGISLSTLAYVHGTLTLDNNALLGSLTSSMTSTIQTIDLGIAVTSNPNLADLGNLTHARLVVGTVNVTNNAQLSACTVRELDCCVNSGVVTNQGNLGNPNNCPTHSWCYAQNNNTCPF